jgi:hypothetical protein
MCELTPSLIILGKFGGVIECFGREYLCPPKALNWKFRLANKETQEGSN